MKLFILKAIVALVLIAGIAAQAGIDYRYAGTGYVIPDGNLSGVYSQIAVSGANSSLSDISVTINVSGGYNGDLYAYLSYDGKLVPLLNRIGVSSGNVFSSSGAGMNTPHSPVHPAPAQRGKNPAPRTARLCRILPAHPLPVCVSRSFFFRSVMFLSTPR